jgi:hypothetical protein
MTGGEFVREYADCWADLFPVVAPNNGPSYTHADVCAASALLNKGGPAALDILGTIPGEGNLLKGGGWRILSSSQLDHNTTSGCG